MKTLTKLLVLPIVLSLSSKLQGQDKTALGLAIDHGSAGSWIGPSIKHNFNEKSALQGDVLFADRSVLVQAFYQHHFPLNGDSGFKFFTGGGPGVAFNDFETLFLIKPMTGLEYNIKSAPLSFAFDWRPTLAFYSYNTRVEVFQTGIGIRYRF